MPTRDVVVVGASAGGVEALRALVAALPADLPAAILVVLHVPATGTSALPQILERSGRLPARHARDGDPLQHGQILIAPPDRHLIVYDGAVTLSAGPTENGHRPAVDVLFRSAARTLGPRVVGVVLSGALDDGTAGMVAVRLRGGVGIVQDPDEALHASMPRSAMAAGGAQYSLRVAEIAALLPDLVREAVRDLEDSPSDLMQTEAALADLDAAVLDNNDPPGEPAGLSCPDCHGSLFQISEGNLVRFRCRVGHAWSPGSLMAQQSASHESALWMALRSLEEKAALAQELGERAIARGHRLTAAGFERQSAEARRAAALVRDLIEQIAGVTSMDAAVAVAADE